MNEILQLYLQHRPHLVASVIARYEQTYLQLSSTQVDELCKWVYKLRDQFVAKGAEVFKAEVEEVKQVHNLFIAIMQYRMMNLKPQL